MSQLPITVPGFNSTYTDQDLLDLLTSFPTFTITVNAQSTLVGLDSHNTGRPFIVSPLTIEVVPPDCCDYVAPTTTTTVIIPTPPTGPTMVTPEPALFPILIVIFIVFLYLHIKGKLSPK